MHALVLVDMQRDFFDVPPLRGRVDELVEHANGLIARAVEADVPVVLVRTLHSPDGDTWASAAWVSSTAVESVSVANCSRCASLTPSACCSAKSRRPRRISSGSPPNGKKPPPSIRPGY